MKYTQIKKQIRLKERENLNYDLELINNDLNEALRRNGKQYKGTEEEQKNKLLKHIHNKHDKSLKEEMLYIESIEQAEKFKGEFIITVEWKKSYMWGANPKAYGSNYTESSSISGCGYDKRSTAVAEVLNQNLSILKLMWDRLEKELRNPKSEYTEQNGFTEKGLSNILPDVLGYGSGWFIKPRFSGGVGVNCFRTILERLGCSWKEQTQATNTDVYIITKRC